MQDIVAQLGFRKILETGFPRDAAEIHFRHADSVLLVKLDDLSRNGKAHG